MHPDFLRKKDLSIGQNPPKSERNRLIEGFYKINSDLNPNRKSKETEGVPIVNSGHPSSVHRKTVPFK